MHYLKLALGLGPEATDGDVFDANDAQPATAKGFSWAIGVMEKALDLASEDADPGYLEDAWAEENPDQPSLHYNNPWGN
jgi:hypothetical protein